MNSSSVITSGGLLRYFVKSAESKPVFGSKEYIVAQYDDVDRAVNCGKGSKEWQAAEAIVRTMNEKKTGAHVYRVVKGTGYDGTVDKDTTKVFAHIVIGLNGPGREPEYLKELAKAIGETNHILEVQIDALDDLWDVIIVLDKESYARGSKDGVKTAQDLTPEKRKSLQDTIDWLAAMAIPQAASAASVYPLSRRFQRGSPGRGMTTFVNVNAPHAGSPEAVIEAMKVDGVPLRRYLRKKGINLFNSSRFGFGTGPAYFDKPVIQALLLAGVDLRGDLGKKAKGAMSVGFRPNTPEEVVRGITAHELGHAYRDARGLSNLGRYKQSKILSSLLGIVGTWRTASKDTGTGETAAWTAGTALSAMPMLAEEFNASRVGSKLVGLKGLGRLRAFMGVPSYAILAASPALATAARKVIDKLRGDK